MWSLSHCGLRYAGNSCTSTYYLLPSVLQVVLGLFSFHVVSVATFTFPAQRLRAFTLSGLTDKPGSWMPSLLPPLYEYLSSSLSRMRFSIYFHYPSSILKVLYNSYNMTRVFIICTRFFIFETAGHAFLVPDSTCARTRRKLHIWLYTQWV